MAHGIKINGDDGTTWFDSSTNAFGFVEILNIAYTGEASTTTINDLDGRFTEAYAIYTPEFLGNYIYDDTFTPGTSGNNRRPSISLTSLGTATPGVDKTLTVTVSIFGSNTVGASTTTTSIVGSGSGTISVISTAGFGSSGTLQLSGNVSDPQDQCTYTGTTSTSFTGVSGVASHPLGSVVTEVISGVASGDTQEGGRILIFAH